MCVLSGTSRLAPSAHNRIKVWVRGTRMTLDHGRVVLNPTSILTPYRSHQSQMETLNLPAFSRRYRWTQHRNSTRNLWTDPEYPLKSLSHDRSFVVGDTYSMTRGT